MEIERSILKKLRENKDLDERTYHSGNAQYWKRGGKYFKWTESDGRQEIGEDEYMKALTDTSATSTPEVNDKNKGDTKSKEVAKDDAVYYDPEYDKVVEEEFIKKQYDSFKNNYSWFSKDYETFKKDNFREVKDGTSQMDSYVRSMDNYIGDAEVKALIDDSLRHNLGNGETYAKVDDFSILSKPKDGIAEVEFDYSVNVRVPVGVDPDTGATEYEEDTEYRTGKYELKVADNTRPSEKESKPKKYNLGDEVSYKGDSYTIISDEDGMVTLRPSYKVDTSTFDDPEEGDSFDDIQLDKSQLGKKDSDTKKEEPSPIEQRRRDFEDGSESSYINYGGVSDFDQTVWDIDGFETTIAKDPNGGYYLQNEDYDMEFDTKGDLVKYLRDEEAEFIGED